MKSHYLRPRIHTPSPVFKYSKQHVLESSYIHDAIKSIDHMKAQVPKEERLDASGSQSYLISIGELSLQLPHGWACLP